jgi:DNA-directed RNA polymerase subunit RPC12/RpoP
MKALHKSELLFCPYRNCGKGFVKPLLLTDSSEILRETYYACPHCHSKLDITVENLHVIRVEKCEGGESAPTPVSCPYDFGYLGALQEDAPIPDECLICPKVLLCSIRK